MKTSAPGLSFVPVHVYRGRRRHIARVARIEAMMTLCGKGWIGTIVGAPATNWPMCKECKALAIEQDANPRANTQEGT